MYIEKCAFQYCYEHPMVGIPCNMLSYSSRAHQVMLSKTVLPTFFDDCFCHQMVVQLNTCNNPVLK